MPGTSLLTKLALKPRRVCCPICRHTETTRILVTDSKSDANRGRVYMTLFCSVLLPPCIPCLVKVAYDNWERNTVVHFCGKCGVRLAHHSGKKSLTTLPMCINQEMDPAFVPLIREYHLAGSSESNSPIENGRRYISSPIASLLQMPISGLPDHENPMDMDTEFLIVDLLNNWTLSRQSEVKYRIQAATQPLYVPKYKGLSERGSDSIFVYKRVPDLGLETDKEILIGSIGIRLSSWKTDITFTQENRYIMVPFPATRSASRDFECDRIYPYPQWLSSYGPLSWEPLNPSSALGIFVCIDAYGRRVAQLAQSLFVRNDLPEEVMDQVIVLYAALVIQRDRDINYGAIVEKEEAEEKRRMQSNWQPNPEGGGG